MWNGTGTCVCVCLSCTYVDCVVDPNWWLWARTKKNNNNWKRASRNVFTDSESELNHISSRCRLRLRHKPNAQSKSHQQFIVCIIWNGLESIDFRYQFKSNYGKVPASSNGRTETETERKDNHTFVCVSRTTKTTFKELCVCTQNTHNSFKVCRFGSVDGAAKTLLSLWNSKTSSFTYERQRGSHLRKCVFHSIRNAKQISSSSGNLEQAVTSLVNFNLFCHTFCSFSKMEKKNIPIFVHSHCRRTIYNETMWCDVLSANHHRQLSDTWTKWKQIKEHQRSQMELIST